MKKYIPFLLMAVFSFFIVSCSRDNDDVIVDPTDNDTYSQVLETTGTFTLDNNGELSFHREFNTALYDADNVLVYRLVDDSGSDVWQFIPRTVYLDNGYELDYDYDFSKHDVYFYASGNFNKQNPPAEVQPWLKNQTFRVVLLPGYFPSASTKGLKTKTADKDVNFKDYDAVIQAYHIDDSKVIKF